VAITLVASFIGPASSPIGLPDILWTLLRGEWMTSHGALLEFDPFTSAPHAAGPVLNVQWLADLFFHGLDALGGLPMVITGTAAVVAITFSLVLAATITASGHVRLSCVAVWVAYALGASNLSPRPQTLGYPLFALFLLAVVRAEYRKDMRLLWVLPLVTAVWANLHGSFFTGWVLLGCVAVGRFIQERSVRVAAPYVVTLCACIVAGLVNPYGPGALLYLASIGSNAVIRDFVTEWAPATVSWREGIMFFASVVVLAGLALKARLRLTAVEVVTLLVFGYLAWSSVRAIVWWGLVIGPTLARLLGSVLPAREPKARDRPLVNAVIIAGIAAIAAAALPWTKSALPILPAEKLGLFTEDTPVQVGAYLRSHDPPPSGKMLNNQAWGGYLEWAAWPRHQVFLDGRIELHPSQVWFDYLDVVFPSARWRALLAQYDVSYLVLSKLEQKELIDDLQSDATWRLDYEDDQAVVFTRTEN